jgi:hypothetical protein
MNTLKLSGTQVHFKNIYSRHRPGGHVCLEIGLAEGTCAVDDKLVLTSPVPASSLLISRELRLAYTAGCCSLGTRTGPPSSAGTLLEGLTGAESPPPPPVISSAIRLSLCQET